MNLRTESFKICNSLTDHRHFSRKLCVHLWLWNYKTLFCKNKVDCSVLCRELAKEWKIFYRNENSSIL